MFFLFLLFFFSNFILVLKNPRWAVRLLLVMAYISFSLLLFFPWGGNGLWFIWLWGSLYPGFVLFFFFIQKSSQGLHLVRML